jgi:hypothetical protein
MRMAKPDYLRHDREQAWKRINEAGARARAASNTSSQKRDADTQHLYKLARVAAGDWWRWQSAELTADLQLYYRPAHDNEWGTLAIARAGQAVPGYVASIKLSRAWTEEYAFRRIVEANLPIMGD